MRGTHFSGWTGPTVEPRVQGRSFVLIAQGLNLDHALVVGKVCINAKRFRNPAVSAYVNDLARLGTKKPSVRWVCAG